MPADSNEAKYLALFRKCYADLEVFHRKWLHRVYGRCVNERQRKAALYAWSRYSMSIRTLDRLLDPSFLPDVYAVSRGCIEFDVALRAVMKEMKYADAYLEFDMHAFARYAKLFKDSHKEKFASLKLEFQRRYDKELEDFGMDSWCRRFDGITGLMRSFDMFVDLYTYTLLCHFTHGSVFAMEALSGKIDNPPMSLASLVRSDFDNYLTSSCEFVRFIWPPSETAEGEPCCRDIATLADEHRHNPAAQFQSKLKMEWQSESSSLD